MGLPLDALVPDSDSFEQDAHARPDSENGQGKRLTAWQFRLAVVKHHRAIYRVCQGILGEQHEAEDVTQETFLRYWQLSAEVRGTRAWLVTVARNKCLDRLRSRKRLVDVDPEFLEEQADDRDPAWHANREESLARLNGLINRLPEPQRSLILLFDIEGLTGAECAEALDLNVNQVKVYLHRARRQLRRALEESRD